MAQGATDYDFIRFQKSINANVKGGARVRQEIMLRKALMNNSVLADAFDSSAVISSGVQGRVKELAENISTHISRINDVILDDGDDLFESDEQNCTGPNTHWETYQKHLYLFESYRRICISCSEKALGKG